jgi:hypothetical protein
VVTNLITTPAHHLGPFENKEPITSCLTDEVMIMACGEAPIISRELILQAEAFVEGK